MRQAIANQGEIRIDRLPGLPDVSVKAFEDRCAKGWIISHSEQGNHHILGGDCEVVERIDAPSGARILYAIVKNPTSLFQDAASPHAPIPFEPGIYEMRIKRYYDPITEIARRVVD